MPYANLENKKSYNQRYRESHKEELVLYSKQYYQTHKSTSLLKDKERYEGKKDEITAKRRADYIKLSEDEKEALFKTQKQYRQAHPERQRDYRLQARYGISLDDYNRLRSVQNNRCLLCSRVFEKSPDVDHDHKTGRIRGLLCRKCNTLIGLLENQNVSLSRLHRFLKSPHLIIQNP
jgi:hypothetical protein